MEATQEATQKTTTNNNDRAAGDEAANGEWKLVTRRKGSPNHYANQMASVKSTVKPYTPYFSKPTYAQMVRLPRMAHHKPHETKLKQSSLPSPPLPTPSITTYYSPPTSPSTKLRFPPQAMFAEWRNRCFKCCRIGHSAAQCRNLRKCGRCWMDGHVASKCKSLSPAATPFYPVAKPNAPRAQQRGEPALADLLLNGEHMDISELQQRGPVQRCYIERDESFYKEVDKLSHAVVMYGAADLGAQQVVAIAVATGLVREEELRVARLSKGRFLIHLPRGLTVDSFVRTLPQELWDQGYSFQQWSLLDDAEITLPKFRVVLDLIDLPMHLRRESAVAKAVSGFALFLGSVDSQDPTDSTHWQVGVAMDDIGRLPPGIAYVMGGMEYPVQITPVSCSKGPIYGPDDFPNQPRRFMSPTNMVPTRSTPSPNGSDSSEAPTLTGHTESSAPSGHTESRVPTLTALSNQEDTYGEPCFACGHNMTTDCTMEGARRSVPGTIHPRGQDQNKSKGVQEGSFVPNDQVPEAPVALVPQKESQMITSETNHGSQRKGKSVASGFVCTSRHNRFTGLIGRGRGRGSEAGQSTAMPVIHLARKGQFGSQRITGGGFSLGQRVKRRNSMQDDVIEGRQTCQKRNFVSGPGEPSRRPATRCGKGAQIRKPRPNKAKPLKDKQAELFLDTAGLYEVKIAYDLSAALADGLGLEETEIAAAIKEDNVERIRVQELARQELTLQAEAEAAETIQQSLETDPMRFEPDPEDEIDSDLD